MTFPLGTLYHGTKFAVEGLSEVLHYELEPIGVKMKIVRPGAIKTDFGGRSFDFANDESIQEYQETVAAILAAVETMFEDAAEPEVAAEVIWNAATDGTDTLRYTAGEDAREYMANRAALDDRAFIAGIKAQLGLQEKQAGRRHDTNARNGPYDDVTAARRRPGAAGR